MEQDSVRKKIQDYFFLKKQVKNLKTIVKVKEYFVIFAVGLALIAPSISLYFFMDDTSGIWNFFEFIFAFCFLFGAIVILFCLGILIDSQNVFYFKKERFFKKHVPEKTFKEINELVSIVDVAPEDIKKKINSKLKEMKNDFQKKETLESIYELFKVDANAKEEYYDFFMEILKEYKDKMNSIHEKDKNLNDALTSAGFAPLTESSNQEELDFKIKEEEQ